MSPYAHVATIGPSHQGELSLTDLPVGTKVFVELPPKEHNLKLTDAEAVTLHTLLRFIGGSADTTARKHTQSIATKLREKGVDFHPDYNKGGAEAFLNTRPRPRLADALYITGRNLY